MNHFFDERIKLLLRQYTGGRTFFEAVDRFCREPDTLEEVHDKVLKTPATIIMSGTFGLAYSNWLNYRGPSFGPIVVRSGLKDLAPEATLEELDAIAPFAKNEFVFMDDTLFSGGTFLRVKKEVEMRGGVLNKAFVCYDGMKEKMPEVSSFYRYYDYYDLNGKRKEN